MKSLCLSIDYSIYVCVFIAGHIIMFITYLFDLTLLIQPSESSNKIICIRPCAIQTRMFIQGIAFGVFKQSHDWCNKGCGMCYPICGMVHIKEPLLLIGKSSLCGGSGFPLSLSEWSLTICLSPYNRR